MSKTYKWDENRRYGYTQHKRAPLPPSQRKSPPITLRMECVVCETWQVCTQYKRAWLCATCKASAVAQDN